jgi:hypothetical protein
LSRQLRSDGQPHEVHLIEGDPERADRALEDRDERHVERNTLGLEQATRFARFLAPGADRSTSTHPVN